MHDLLGLLFLRESLSPAEAEHGLGCAVVELGLTCVTGNYRHSLERLTGRHFSVYNYID